MTTLSSPVLTSPTSRFRLRRCVAAAALGLALTACTILLGVTEAATIPRHKSHDLKQQVEQLEEQWRAAQLADDVATMDKLLSDDYIGISLNGQVNTKTQQLDRLSSRRVALTRLELSEMKVKLIGAIAIVTSRAQVEGSSDGASVKGIYRYTRVYQRMPSGSWKITSFEATRIPQGMMSSGAPSTPAAAQPPEQH